MTVPQSKADEQRYPRYRILTGQDNAAFCLRISEALDLGYELYGSLR